jgi:beta-glucosidase
MRGDAQRHIQSRLMYPENATVIPHLTVSMNDESLYGFIEPGQSKPFPAGMRVEFFSDRPDVVAVGRGSTIRALRNGVATITATVTYRGVTRSTQFVVRVLSELDRLSIDGRRIRGFHPDTFSYDSNRARQRSGATGQRAHTRPGRSRQRDTGERRSGARGR